MKLPILHKLSRIHCQLSIIHCQLLIALFFLSCEDLLTEKPNSGYDKDSFFTNEANAEMAVMGIYSSLSDYRHYGWYEMALHASDDTYYTARTHSDNTIHDLVHYRATASNEWVEMLWQLKYPRAGATPYTDANYASLMAAREATHPLTFIDASAAQGRFRTALYWERGFELSFEGQRKSDLIRWGVLGDALRLFGSQSSVNAGTNAAYPAWQNFVSGKHELLPIPLVEMQSNARLEGGEQSGILKKPLPIPPPWGGSLKIVFHMER